MLRFSSKCKVMQDISYKTNTHNIIHADFCLYFWPVHTNPEIFENAFFFLHESAFRPHKTIKSAHLNRVYLKLLFRLKFFFFDPTDLRSREDD